MLTLAYIKRADPRFFQSTEFLKVKVVPNTFRTDRTMFGQEVASFIVSEEQPGRKGTKIYRLVKFMTGGWEKVEPVVELVYDDQSESVWARDLDVVREQQDRLF